MVRVDISWTSNGDGNATDTTTKIRGTIERIDFVPGSGDVQPTDQYDVTLQDVNGFDALLAQGANLSNSTASRVVRTGTSPVLPYATIGPLSLSVSGAGDSNSGTILIYVRR